MADLDHIVGTRNIIVCAGSGGVGKTTIAAVLAMEAAMRGRRAVVVTIDPAKRLADTLGIGELSNTPKQIDGPWPGELWALMLDVKTTFDNLVTTYSDDTDQAQRILLNPFYRNISGALSGTQEYMAGEKLYELHESGDYDIVVVDTPPSRNALDFLAASRRLTRFLDHRLYKMLMAPTRAYMKAVNVAAQAFVRTVGKVVGGEVLDDALAFFQAFEGMEAGFRDRAARVQSLLTAEETAYVLVASPQADAVEEAAYFARKLKETQLPVEALIVNRMHPRFGPGRSEADRARATTLDGTAIGSLYSNLADFRQMADEERTHLAGLAEQVDPAPVVEVPFLPEDVHDLAALAEIGTHMFVAS